MDITQRIALGYGIEQETAEAYVSTYSLRPDTKWDISLERHFNQLLGWDYCATAVSDKYKEELIERSVGVKKEALRQLVHEENVKRKQETYDALSALVGFILILVLGFYTVDSLATNWVRLTRDCDQTDQCQL